jgi:hypothetical protein
MTQSGKAANIMNQGTTRWIFRGIHIVFSIPILGFIYSRLTKFQTAPP